MITSGEKKEEYRDSTNYWFTRICNFQNLEGTKTITFSNGYSKTRDQFEIELESFAYGQGNEEWGAAPGVFYHIFKLGKIIKKNF